MKYDNKHEVLNLVLQGQSALKGVQLQECIAVGDGENDIPLFREVGYSIAFHPLTEEIAKSANTSVTNGGLLEVMSIILSQLE